MFFCSLQNRLTPKIGMLYFVIINIVHFNLSCVWFSRKNKERQSKEKQGMAKAGLNPPPPPKKKKTPKNPKQNKKGKDEAGCHYVRTYGSTNQPSWNGTRAFSHNQRSCRHSTQLSSRNKCNRLYPPAMFFKKIFSWRSVMLSVLLYT